MDVADIPVMIIVGHVEGQRRGDARWWEHHVTPQPEHMPSRWCPGHPVLLEEDAETVTKLLAVRLVPKGLKIVFLPVCWI